MNMIKTNIKRVLVGIFLVLSCVAGSESWPGRNEPKTRQKRHTVDELQSFDSLESFIDFESKLETTEWKSSSQPIPIIRPRTNRVKPFKIPELKETDSPRTRLAAQDYMRRESRRTLRKLAERRPWLLPDEVLDMLNNTRRTVQVRPPTPPKVRKNPRRMPCKPPQVLYEIYVSSSEEDDLEWTSEEDRVCQTLSPSDHSTNSDRTGSSCGLELIFEISLDQL